MAVKHSKCSCGVKVTVLTGSDVKFSCRADGKKVVYTSDYNKGDYCLYVIYRCRKCFGVIAETCPDAAYGEKQKGPENEPIQPRWYQEKITKPFWFWLLYSVLASVGATFLFAELLKALGAL